MNKSDIITSLNDAHLIFWNTAIQLPNQTIAINGKWSVCQNVEHINITLLRVSNYLALPKSSIETNFGLSERVSTSNERIIKVFRNALENGAKATDSFIPELNLLADIKELVGQGNDLLKVFISNLKNWSEEDLETYNCPHPVLGKITVREILYFTIYHVQHHTETLKKMSLKETENYQIENTSTADLDFIYSLFEEAITYIKKNNYVGWTTYDKNFIKQDIENNLQFKITNRNEILCVFSICFTDVVIWREMEKGDAIYLHRIVVNPKFKGQKQFEKILNWNIEFAKEKGLKHIRMDTWADNANIIEYYKSFGFIHIEDYTTPNTPELPEQHRNLKVALLEMKL